MSTAKKHIFDRQQRGRLRRDRRRRRAFARRVRRGRAERPAQPASAPCRWRSTGRSPAGISFRAGKLIDADGFLADFADVPTLPGDHNAQNAACAWAACRWLRMLARGDRDGPEELSRPAAPPGAGRGGGQRRSTSTTARRPTPTPRRARCRPIATSTGSSAARRRRAAWRRSRRWFDRIRHAFLIGEATELFAGQLEGKLPFDRCGDLQSALERRARARASRGDRAPRWCCCRRPAPRGTSGRATSIAAMRSARWRAPCRAPRAWGGRHDPGSARRPQRDRPMVVDGRPLGAGRRAGDHGVRRDADARRLAAGGRAHRRRLLHVRQAPVRLPADGAGADARRSRSASPRHVRRLALLVFLRQRGAAGRHLRDRRRDQGRAALDLRARPVERAAVGVREAQPRRDLRLAAGAEPRRAARAGLFPLHPAGRRRAGAADACSPTSA